MQRDKNRSESPTNPNRNSSTKTPRKKCVSVETNTEAYKCEKCQEKDHWSYYLNDCDDLRDNYIKSINYINSCHSIMNELLSAKAYSSTTSTSKSSIALMPDLPNFLDIYAALQKNSSSSVSNQSSKTYLSSDQTQRRGSSLSLTESATNTDQIQMVHKQEMTEEDANDSSKTKRSFIESVPEIKTSQQFKQMQTKTTETVNSLQKSSGTDTSDSDGSTKQTINFVERNKQNVKCRLLKNRERKCPSPKHSSETNCEKKQNEAALQEKSRSVIHQSMSSEDYRRKILIGQNIRLNVEKTEKCGDANTITEKQKCQEDVFDRYAKELLETSDSSKNASPRKGCLVDKVRSSSTSCGRKVTFSDHLIEGPHRGEERVLKVHSPTEETDFDYSEFLKNTNRVTTMDYKEFKKSRENRLPNATMKNEGSISDFRPTTYKNALAGFYLHNIHLKNDANICQPYNSNINIGQTRSNLASSRDSNGPASYMLTLNQIQKQQQPRRKRIIEETDKDVRKEAPPRKENDAQTFNIANYKYDENSDTDYIPSDSESENNSPNSSQRSKESASHPLKLSQQNLHCVDEKVVVNMGLFTEKGELPKEIIKILEEEKSNRASDARNKPFRAPRRDDEHNNETGKEDEVFYETSSESAHSSDIRVDENGEFLDTEKDEKMHFREISSNLLKSSGGVVNLNTSDRFPKRHNIVILK